MARNTPFLPARLHLDTRLIFANLVSSLVTILVVSSKEETTRESFPDYSRALWRSLIRASALAAGTTLLGGHRS